MEFFITEESIYGLFIVTISVVFFSIFGIAFFSMDYIQVLIYIELALVSININFVYISLISDDILGQIFVIFILSVAAAESAIALSIFIVLYRIKGDVIIFLKCISFIS